jgi:translation initiation factor 5A
MSRGEQQMIEIKRLKSGSYIVHKDQPHRVLKNNIVVTGTHSHTKNKLEIQNILNDKYETLVYPPHERLEDVEITRKKAQLLAMQENQAQIMDLQSYETFNAALKDSLEDLNEGDEVSYIEFQGSNYILEKWKK